MVVKDMFSQIAIPTINGGVNNTASITQFVIFLYITLVGVLVFYSLHFQNTKPEG
jgi:hypothetical protein